MRGCLCDFQQATAINGFRVLGFGFRGSVLPLWVQSIRGEVEFRVFGVGFGFRVFGVRSEFRIFGVRFEFRVFGVRIGFRVSGLGLGSGYSGSGAPWRGQNRRSSGGRTWRLNILSLRCSNGFRLSGFGFRGSVLQVLVQSSQGHLREAKVADLQVTVRVRFYRFGFRVIRGYGDLGEAKVADLEVTVR